MSVTHRIPLEILSMVFLHVLPPYKFDAPKNPERVPNVLSQVCRRWRALTLALPALWASLNITCNSHTLHPRLDTIHTHLQRSVTHPLSIALTTFDFDDPDDPGDLDAPPNPHFPTILAALVAARSRWCHVTIRLMREATRETIDAITEGDAPLLLHFVCDYYNSDLSQESPLVPLRAVRRYPQLRILSYSSGAVLSLPTLEDGAWLHLRWLLLCVSLTVSDCFTLLQLSPRLSTAAFHTVDSRGDTTASRRLRHGTLRYLTAAGMCITALIDDLTLPALVSLQLEGPSPDAPHTTLYTFLERSTPPLCTLFLTNLSMPEPELLRILALARGLEHFSIKDLPGSIPYTAALVRALHPSHGVTPLCPRLCTLHLTLEAPDGMYSAMLRARRGADADANGVTELIKVKITLKGNDHERDNVEVQALIAEGLGVVVHQEI